MTTLGTSPAPPTGVAPLAGLAAQLVDLKRVRAARAPRPLADELFVRAWTAIAAGADPGDIALRSTAAAVAALRLGPVDGAALAAGGLPPGRIADVRADAVREALAGMPALAATLAPHVVDDTPAPVEPPPAFALALADQPRAGATAPDAPRIVLHPPESHAGHCAVVAVLAALLALHEGDPPGVPFLAGLAHHLHNATLPDGGFAAEVLLGDDLGRVIAAHRDAALAQLAEPARSRAARAATLTERLDSDAARQVSAADVLDRVLELAWHARAAAFTLDVALDDLEVVHAGPMQAFGRAVLDEAGLC